jgi:hypothetical protein
VIRQLVDGAPSQRWAARIATAAVVWGLLVVALAAADAEPNPGPLAALVLAVTIAVSLALDLGNAPAPSLWPTTPLSEAPHGNDQRVQRLQRLVESAQSHDGRSEPLRELLRAVVNQSVAARHGITYDVDPQRYTELVGTDLVEWLGAGGPDEPAAPITRRELLGILQRIEAL